MTPQQLHQTAQFIRERYSPPDPVMTTGQYVSHEAMHALADALDHTATEPHVDERPSTEGGGGAPDEVHALLDFIWCRTTESAGGLISLQGADAQHEADSYFAEHGGELLRWERHVLAVAQQVARRVDFRRREA